MERSLPKKAPHLDQDEDPPVALDDSALLGAPPMRSKLGLPSRTSIKRNCSEQFRAMVEQVVEVHLNELLAIELRSKKPEPVVKLSPRRTIESQGHRVRYDRSASQQSSERRAHPSVFADAMAKQHEKLPEVHASQILDVWDTTEDDLSGLMLADDDNWMERTSSMKKNLGCGFMVSLVQSVKYEFSMACFLCLNIIWMAFELQVYGTFAGEDLAATSPVQRDIDGWATCFMAGEITFTVIFALDVTLRMAVLRRYFWLSPLNYIDLLVSITSIVEIVVYYAVKLPVNSVFFRLLRIGKLARAIRMFSMTSVLASLQLLVKCLASSRDMLFWSFCLLTVVQGVACLIVSTLCRDFVEDERLNLLVREEVFQYYGTFTRSFLTMFEIMFANWGPPCRVLVDNVSEWFSVFFLLYRCVLGFAVLNVVNAVFVQQTMKTASSDEELAFKQKQKDMATYTKKVKKLFSTIDYSGDGSINLEEFSKLVKSPKLQFWMSQLELEYHDLLSLFEFLDNGDGEITLMEFIDGAVRLRGNAKALDVWRMETKLEVLMQEVLHVMNPPGHEDDRQQSVQDVFNNSSFKHIKCTTERMRNDIQPSEGEDLVMEHTKTA